MMDGVWVVSLHDVLVFGGNEILAQAAPEPTPRSSFYSFDDA